MSDAPPRAGKEKGFGGALITDAQRFFGKLPVEKRLTQTNIDRYYKGEHKLLPSGLLGPVTLQAESKTE